MKVSYSSNNSGGSWWLTDENWKALEAAGWTVDWYETSEYRYRDFSKYGGDVHSDQYPDGRFLGALAGGASIEAASMREAIENWETITGQRAAELGCACCGTPHSFSSDSGEHYAPEYPQYGDDY